MEKNTKRTQLWDEWDGEYIGNMWGWRFSMLGLALIIAVSLLVWYRYSQLEESEKSNNPIEIKAEPIEEETSMRFYKLKKDLS